MVHNEIDYFVINKNSKVLLNTHYYVSWFNVKLSHNMTVASFILK